MLVVMAVILKGARSKAQMQISNLTFGGTFPVVLEDGQEIYLEGNKCGRPTGGAHVNWCLF